MGQKGGRSSGSFSILHLLVTSYSMIRHQTSTSAKLTMRFLPSPALLSGSLDRAV